MRRTTPVRWLVLSAALVMLASPSLASAKAWLGVYTQEVTSELRDALDLQGDGVLVSRVVPGSPAERAGVRKGDVITSVDRRKVDSPAELSDVIGEQREGESVSLSISRRGDDVILAVRLGERPGDSGEGDDDLEVPTPAPMAPMAPKAPRAPKAPKAPEMRWYSSQDGDVDEDEIREHIRRIAPDVDLKGLEGLKALDGLKDVGPGQHRIFVNGGGRGRLGVRIETLSPDLAAALGAAGSKGVLVVEVLDGTPAEKAGLRAGDVISAVEGESVADADDLVRALRDENGRVSLSVVRRGERRTVEAELEDAPRVIRLRDGVIERKVGPAQKDRIVIKRKDAGEDDAEVREQLRELREQLRELREQLREQRR